MKKSFAHLLKLLKLLFKGLAQIWLWSARIIGSFILLLLVLVLILAKQFKTAEETSFNGKTLIEGGEDQIAVIKLQGEIMLEETQSQPLSFTPFVITPARVDKVIAEIKANKQIKAVVLQINSPGGSVVPSQEIFQAFYQLRQTMPVVAYFEEVAASGGYYIGAAASKIVAHPATLTGSIGVIMISPNMTGLYDKLGIDIRTYQSGEFKDMGSMAREATEKEQAIFASLIKDNYELFLHDLMMARNVERDVLVPLADGRVYTGLQAEQNGLVDQVGNLGVAFDEAAKLAGINDPTIVELGTMGFWDSLFMEKMSLIKPSLLDQIIPTSRKAGMYYLWMAN